jgi:cytochrome b subunit of formate dehydrogenase
MAGQPAFVRFEPIHRLLHVIVIVSFLGLALTGLPLKYSDQDWAKVLAGVFGGFGSTSIWHHVCAVATIFYFATHLTWMSRRVVAQRGEGVHWKVILFGPDSPVPNFRDLFDLLRMARWFVGLGPKPVFERWTYWEKFDYWAVFWGVGIIGTSGLILWFPNLFTRFLPGVTLNIAKVIHSEEALLATGFIFAIHFFNTHLRAEKFPIDLAVLTGLVSEEEMKEERPEYLERLRKEGQLESLRDTAPSRAKLLLIVMGGFIALAIGLALLAGILFAALEA